MADGDSVPTGTVFGAGGTQPSQADMIPGGTVFGTGTPPAKESPNPWDPLALTPPTAADYARHYGGIVGRTLMSLNPVDAGANLWRGVADFANRNLGTSFSGGWTPPGEHVANVAGLPEARTQGEAALAQSVALPVGALLAGGTAGGIQDILTGGSGAVGRSLSTAARQIPVQAALGGAMGYLGFGLPPYLQALYGAALGGAAGEFLPGMRSGVGDTTLALRDAAQARNIDIPTAAVGPWGARGAYSLTGMTGSGAVPAADRTFRQWADSGARDIGATAADNGHFTQQVFDEARSRTIDPLYTTVQNGAAAVPLTTNSQLSNGILQIAQDVNHNMPPGSQTRLLGVIRDLTNAASGNTANPGTIPGAMAVKMVQGNGKLQGMIDNPLAGEDPTYARQLRTLLENSTRAVMAPNVRSVWDRADRFWGNYRTYQDAADPKTGLITPESLGAATDRAVRNGYYPIGGGDPGLNAQIGTRFGIRAPAEAGGVTPGPPWGSIMHSGGGALGGAALTELYEGLRAGEWMDPHTLAYGALAYPAAVTANRVMRGMSGGPNPPGALGYYSRLLMNPGLYSSPVTLNAPNTNAAPP